LPDTVAREPFPCLHLDVRVVECGVVPGDNRRAQVAGSSSLDERKSKGMISRATPQTNLSSRPRRHALFRIAQRLPFVPSGRFKSHMRLAAPKLPLKRSSNPRGFSLGVVAQEQVGGALRKLDTGKKRCVHSVLEVELANLFDGSHDATDLEAPGASEPESSAPLEQVVGVAAGEHVVRPQAFRQAPGTSA
jgi:hypothetical protein